MTQLAQPYAAAPSQTTPSAPTESVTVEDESTAGLHTISFSELVYAHFSWWSTRAAPDADESLERRYDLARAAFERRHGEIITAYWCSNVESAVALTEKRSAHAWRGPTWGFHRESDWATQASPEVAVELHRCDELAVRANTVLSGVRQRICMQLVVASAAHLLSLVDAGTTKPDRKLTTAALVQERAALDEAEKYYKGAANGQAQMVYFGGMASVAVVLSVVAAIWLGISWATPLAALIAGAIGAVVSVIQRINNGKFTLEYDVGGPYAFFLGGLRPLIGGTFAMAISFAFTGGLLHLPVAAGESTDNRRLALLVLGFLAGFSERWAQDTLTTLLPAGGGGGDATGSGPPVTTPPPVTPAPAPTAAAAPADLPQDGVT